MVRFFLFAFLTSFLFGCATFREQKSLDIIKVGDREEKAIHTFYIAGGLGNLKEGKKEEILGLLKDQLEKAPENSTMIFTGDNISPKEDQWEFDKKRIELQIGITENVKGWTRRRPGDGDGKRV